MDTITHILREKGDREIFFLPPGASVFFAAQEMCTRRVGALLVLEGEEPVGIVSERDLMTRVILAGKDPTKTTVADVMTREVVCVEEGASAESAMAIMTERRIRHLPVVQEGRVSGMISIGDLVRWASRNQAFEIRVLTDYIRGKYPG